MRTDRSPAMSKKGVLFWDRYNFATRDFETVRSFLCMGVVKLDIEEPNWDTKGMEAAKP